MITATGASPSQQPRRSLDKATTPASSRAESRAGSRASHNGTAPGPAAALPTRPPTGLAPAFAYPGLPPASAAQLPLAARHAPFPPAHLGLPGMLDLSHLHPAASAALPFPGLFPAFSSSAGLAAHFQPHLFTTSAHSAAPAPVTSSTPAPSQHHQPLQLAPEFQSLRLPRTTTATSSAADFAASLAALSTSSAGAYAGAGASGFPIPTSLFNPAMAGGSGLPTGGAPSFNPMDPYGLIARQRHQLDLLSITQQRDEALRRQQHAAFLNSTAAARYPASAQPSPRFPSQAHPSPHPHASPMEGAGALSGLLEQELLARQRLLHSGFGHLPPPSPAFQGHLPGLDPLRPPVPGLPYGFPGMPNGKLPPASQAHLHQSFSQTLEQLARHKAAVPATTAAAFPVLPTSSTASRHPPHS